MQRDVHSSVLGYRAVTMRQDNVRIRIPTWLPDHADPSAIIGKSAYRKRDSRFSRNVNQTAARCTMHLWMLWYIFCCKEMTCKTIRINQT